MCNLVKEDVLTTTAENLGWFTEHIQSLCQHPAGIKMLLHVTREGSKESLSQSQPLDTPQATRGVLDGRVLGDMEKEMDATVNPAQKNDSRDVDSLCDIKYDKLEAEKAICQALEAVQPGKRILIAASGP